MFSNIFPAGYQWLRKLPEVPTLFLFFAFAVSEAITYNFSMYRACYVDFGYPKSDCELLGTGVSSDVISVIEEDVMHYVIQVLTYQEIIIQVIPALLGLFVGPWSDKNGRRPIMVTSTFGMCVGGTISMVFILVDASVWFFLLPVIPMALFGGVLPFMTASFCYIVDITTDANRGVRMGIYQGFMSAGTLIGTLVTSYLLDLGGYLTVYIVVVACFFLAFFYNAFFLVESLKIEKTKRLTLKVFNFKHIVDLLKVTFKRRENNATVILVTLILMGIVTKFGTSGAATVTYMFLIRKLNWDLEQFTLFKTVREVLTICATVVGVYVLHKKFRIREAPLILVSSVFLIGGMIATGCASQDWHVYVGGVMVSLSGVGGAMTNTLISKLVEPHETGKVFSVLTVIQSLSLLGALPLYQEIYGATLTTSPGAFNFITAGMYCLMFIMTVVILVLQKYSLKENLFIMDKQESSDYHEDDDKIQELSTDNIHKLA